MQVCYSLKGKKEKRELTKANNENSEWKENVGNFRVVDGRIDSIQFEVKDWNRLSGLSFFFLCAYYSATANDPLGRCYLPLTYLVKGVTQQWSLPIRGGGKGTLIVQTLTNFGYPATHQAYCVQPMQVAIKEVNDALASSRKKVKVVRGK